MWTSSIRESEEVAVAKRLTANSASGACADAIYDRSSAASIEAAFSIQDDSNVTHELASFCLP